MGKLGWKGVAAFVVAGLIGGTAAAADDDDDAPKKQSTWHFGPTGRYGKPKPVQEHKPEPPKKADKTPAPPPPSPAVNRQREFNAYLRRMDACDRLYEIGLANGDEAMLRRVDQLKERVWAIYQEKTNLVTDEGRLDGQLNTKTAADRLLDRKETTPETNRRAAAAMKEKP